jgi:hypothetical protein
MKPKFKRQADGKWRIEGVEICRPHDYYGDKWDAARCASMYEHTLATKPVGLLHIGHNEGDGKQRTVVGKIAAGRVAGETFVTDYTDLNPRAALMIHEGELPGRSPEFAPAKDGSDKRYISSLALLASQEAFFDQYGVFEFEKLTGSDLETLKADAAKHTLAEVRSTAPRETFAHLRAVKPESRMAEGEMKPGDGMKPADGAALSTEDVATIREIIAAWKAQKAGGADGQRAALPIKEPNVSGTPAVESPELRAVKAELAEQKAAAEALKRSVAATEKERETEAIKALFTAKRAAGVHITAEDEADVTEDALRRERGDKRTAFLTRTMARFTDDAATRGTVETHTGVESTTDETAKAIAEAEAKHAADLPLRRHIRSLGTEARAAVANGLRNPRFLIEAGIDQFNEARRRQA